MTEARAQAGSSAGASAATGAVVTPLPPPGEPGSQVAVRYLGLSCLAALEMDPNLPDSYSFNRRPEPEHKYSPGFIEKTERDELKAHGETDLEAKREERYTKNLDAQWYAWTHATLKARHATRGTGEEKWEVHGHFQGTIDEISHMLAGLMKEEVFESQYTKQLPLFTAGNRED